MNRLDQIKVGWNAKGVAAGSSEPQLRAIGRGAAYAQEAKLTTRRNQQGDIWFRLSGPDGDRYITWSDLEIVEAGAFMTDKREPYGDGAPAEWAGLYRVWEVLKKEQRINAQGRTRDEYIRSRALDRNAILRFDAVQRECGLTPESPHWVCPPAHMPKYVIAVLLLLGRNIAITTTTRNKAFDTIETYFRAEMHRIHTEILERA